MFRYNKDMERVMLAKKKEFVSELEATGRKIMRELMSMKKSVHTDFCELLADYNRIDFTIKETAKQTQDTLNRTTEDCISRLTEAMAGLQLQIDTLFEGSTGELKNWVTEKLESLPEIKPSAQPDFNVDDPDDPAYIRNRPVRDRVEPIMIYTPYEAVCNADNTMTARNVDVVVDSNVGYVIALFPTGTDITDINASTGIPNSKSAQYVDGAAKIKSVSYLMSGSNYGINSPSHVETGNVDENGNPLYDITFSFGGFASDIIPKGYTPVLYKIVRNFEVIAPDCLGGSVGIYKNLVINPYGYTMWAPYPYITAASGTYRLDVDSNGQVTTVKLA